MGTNLKPVFLFSSNLKCLFVPDCVELFEIIFMKRYGPDFAVALKTELEACNG